ncbi:hypothetical protein, unlikely [Trypanosoma congolense IL3000]|uniref:Uncharacterized protein n=1 Tax=Trypanosoma congolense (strain IL3000) TaxID=1068625 RepID=F9W5X7_TRYCI|nr:hypothetical protein, unlikely [Trypanosoma congolense IL3000]
MHLVCPVVASWALTQKGLPFVEATGGEVRAGACGQAAAPRTDFPLPCHAHSEMFFTNKERGFCLLLVRSKTSSIETCDGVRVKQGLFFWIQICHSSSRYSDFPLQWQLHCAYALDCIRLSLTFIGIKHCLITFRWIVVMYSMREHLCKH